MKPDRWWLPLGEDCDSEYKSNYDYSNRTICVGYNYLLLYKDGKIINNCHINYVILS